MPRRILSEEQICQDRAVDKLDWAAMAFYQRLLFVMDDYGIFPAAPEVIRGRCFPYSVDRVRVADITRWIVACETAGVLVISEADGITYLQLKRPLWQPRAAESKYPVKPRHKRMATATRAELFEQADASEPTATTAPSCAHLRASGRKCAQPGAKRSEAEAGTYSNADANSVAEEGVREPGIGSPSIGFVPANPPAELVAQQGRNSAPPPPHNPPPPPPASGKIPETLLQMPCSGARGFPITDELVKSLEPLFPEVDVLGEIRLCVAYLQAKAEKRPNPRSAQEYLSRWITNDVRDGKALRRAGAGGTVGVSAAEMIDRMYPKEGGAQ